MLLANIEFVYNNSINIIIGKILFKIILYFQPKFYRNIAGKIQAYKRNNLTTHKIVKDLEIDIQKKSFIK